MNSAGGLRQGWITCGNPWISCQSARQLDLQWRDHRVLPAWFSSQAPPKGRSAPARFGEPRAARPQTPHAVVNAPGRLTWLPVSRAVLAGQNEMSEASAAGLTAESTVAASDTVPDVATVSRSQNRAVPGSSYPQTPRPKLHRAGFSQRSMRRASITLATKTHCRPAFPATWLSLTGAGPARFDRPSTADFKALWIRSTLARWSVLSLPVNRRPASHPLPVSRTHPSWAS